MAALHIIRMDDRDPSIVYSADTWGQAGNGNEYLHTTSRSNRVGAYMRIPFNGTKVVIYGTIDSNTIGTLPHALITVDDARGADFVASPQTADIQYQQKFWESPDLPSGAHVLSVSITAGSTGRAAFSFDYVEYYLGDAGNATSASTSSGAPTTQMPTPTKAGADVSSTAGSASASDRSRVSTPMVVGVVCGVFAALFILLGVLFGLVRRRRRRRGGHGDPDALQRGFGRSPSPREPNERTITPFLTHSRNPSHQILTASSSTNDLTHPGPNASIGTTSEYYLALRAAAQTPSIRNDVQNLNFSGKAGGGGERVDEAARSRSRTRTRTRTEEGEETGGGAGGGGYVPPPRYESFRFPRLPPPAVVASAEA